MNETLMRERDLFSPEARFKALSDQVWGHSLSTLPDRFNLVDSELPVNEVVDRINGIVGEVDEAFVIMGAGKNLNLGQLRNRNFDLSIGSSVMDKPTSASAGTFNWDAFIPMRPEHERLGELPEEKIYSRELVIRVALGSKARAIYSIRRNQKPDPAYRPNLSLHFNHSSIQGFGNPGKLIVAKKMPASSEMEFLNLVSEMIG